MFTIEDGLHGDELGPFRARDEAMSELRRLSEVPWDEAPNRAPCVGWAECGRRYELIQYGSARMPSSEVARDLKLEISAAGVRWH